MKFRYKKILSKFEKANAYQRQQMYKTLYDELKNLDELLSKMAEVLEE